MEIAKEIETIQTDVLVIGSGMAGLRAAIEARRSGLDVLLVDKSLLGGLPVPSMRAGWDLKFFRSICPTTEPARKRNSPTTSTAPLKRFLTRCSRKASPSDGVTPISTIRESS